MGFYSNMVSSNKDNQRKLRTRGMFMKRKSYSDIKKEYAKTYDGTFKYNEATVAEIFDARREVLHNRKATALRIFLALLAIVGIGTFIIYHILVK